MICLFLYFTLLSLSWHLESREVKVPKHSPHEGVGGVGHLGEVIELWTKEKVSKLGVSHEDNHEHEPKSNNIRSTPGKLLFLIQNI